MSNPPPPPLPPSSSLPSTHHHQPPHITPISAAAAATATTTTNREYRKGNWTMEETLTLITAKRLDEERHMKRSTTSPSKPGEPRWKWVQSYCWDHGCFRSQNQCNDKWDNLLRDYKKVRQYQSQIPQSSDHHIPSYWSMERQQRKLHNLPTNMSPEVYEALNHVLQTKYNTQQRQQQKPSEQSGVRRDQPPPPPEIATAAPVTVSESDSSETESSEDPGAEKDRKIESSIRRSASVLARALKSREKKKERRHQQVMELEQRRLQIQETQNQVNQKGITDLLAAMTNLSGAIHSLISNTYDQT